VKNLHILRGDLIKGGAKMPALLRYLPKLNHTHVGYVGSVYGAGAWAVAEACAALDIKSTLFLSKSEYSPPWLPMALETGTNIIWSGPLPVEQIRAKAIADHPDIYNLPLGFDCSGSIADMASVLRQSIPNTPPEIWVSALSGVVARAACMAFPETPIHAVCAAKHYGDIGQATPHIAPEKFHKLALNPPPYPSCPFSCAKIWQFAEKQAVSGAYILNVGI
jgi:hypothetical protein